MNVPANPLRFGLCGCGRIARVHAERLHADGRGRIVALTDNDRSAAEHLRNELVPDADLYDDLDRMLELSHLDAVIICTPTQLHHEQAVRSLEHGLHVLCEKPLADSRAKIVELIELSQRADRRFSVAYQRRNYATYRTLRREVRSGRWGEVRAISSHNYEDWQHWITGTWRDDPALNTGGFIGDAGSHKIDTVFYVTGLDPVEVFARCWSRGSNVEVTASVSALLTGDVPLTIDFVGRAQQLGESMYVHCAEADLIIRDRRLLIGRAGREEPITNLEEDSNPNVAFLDLLLGKSENSAPPDCALPVFDFTSAMLESSRSGRNVTLQ